MPFARVEHAKYMVVDGERMWLGTANWGPGYFLQSRNLGLAIDNRPLASQARAVFEASWTAPSAAAVTQGKYPEKVRGETPPPGTAKVYGK
jgi:phosphatidylserine/phosphatidylglycerophosphate/cardiolipin synthase-like enzyme